jgi:hypothetical protein
MNIILPIHFRNTDYQVEFNEPDSIPDRKKYIVRIESVRSAGEPDAEMDEQTGKEFEYTDSENIQTDVAGCLNLIIKTYGDHIKKDVDCLVRV